ncbi:hypothetical protein GALMADRAFT_632551 [Galerina marginata CBS 339.88]|uniref:Transmembrane protein n=1 Tax=Galerina marginata (strain CBS 339.88) TaxID=685588 RepID=A0A067SS62_GALM3|nr:hypothetical protein GALMADRAFT_632551 [Galerina marginata CBS 339.88]
MHAFLDSTPSVRTTNRTAICIKFFFPFPIFIFVSIFDSAHFILVHARTPPFSFSRSDLRLRLDRPRFQSIVIPPSSSRPDTRIRVASTQSHPHFCFCLFAWTFLLHFFLSSPRCIFIHRCLPFAFMRMLFYRVFLFVPIRSSQPIS